MLKQASLTYIDVEEAPRPRKRLFRNVQPAIRRYIPLLLLLFAAYRFIGLSFGEMQQWDEAIYALRTDAVFFFGDVWDQSPHMLRGSYYSAHPPLYVWGSMACRLMFGDGVWVYRLTSALAGAISVLLLYRIGRSFTTRAFALAAAGWFAAAPLPAFMSRQGQLDLLLACTMLGTMLFMIRYLGSGKKGLVAASLLLGLALMTKLFYAFSLPAAALVTAALFTGESRSRFVRLGMLLPVLSAPVWLPWLVSFIVNHGGGNPMFLFSNDSPLGASIAGLEGSGRSAGLYYYLNQLVVHLGILFPLFAVGLYHAFRKMESPGLVFLSVFSLVQGAELLLLRSSFEVYLIPLLGPAAIIAIRVVPRIRQWSIGRRLLIALAMGVSVTWSLSASLRAAIREVVLHLATPSVIPASAISDSILLLLLFMLTAAVVLLTWKRGRLRAVYTSGFMHLFVLVLWVTTAARLWITDAETCTDGARKTVAAAMTAQADTIVLVGNGDNPQLTWYLRGADIGWVEDESRVFVRMEPQAIGVESILHRLRGMRAARTGVIIEKDEISAGVYRSASDVLPGRYTTVTETPRYRFVMLGGEQRGP